MIPSCPLRQKVVHAFQSRIWNMAPSLLTAWSQTSYFTSLNLSSLIFKPGRQAVPSLGRCCGSSAVRINRCPGLGVPAVLRDPQAVFTLAAHQHVTFPSTVSRAGESPPQAQKAVFFSFQPEKFSPNDQLKPDWKPGAKNTQGAGRASGAHDRSWLGFPAPPEKSERLRCLNPQPEPLI